MGYLEFNVHSIKDVTNDVFIEESFVINYY